MLTKETFIVIFFFAVLALLLLGASALVGWLIKLIFSLSRNYGLYVGYALAALSIFVALWGSTIGFSSFEVKRVTLFFDDLPGEFDGYRIIHITDAHLGSFNGRESLWTETVDAMLKEDADLIVFTGDLQNRTPEEIVPFVEEMSRLKARDGVFAVLGNHDYGYPPTASSPRRVREMEERAGWKVLVNEHVDIERGNAHIILGGMDNDGDGKHFPQRGDVKKTLSTAKQSRTRMCENEMSTSLVNQSSAKGSICGVRPVSPNDFIIMLEHDPTSWRRNILPNSHAQLTLSGHTHAMQFGLFGWSPSKWIYSEWRALFMDAGRQLYVSSGVGGVVPFRFGMPREMVVIELKVSTACRKDLAGRERIDN